MFYATAAPHAEAYVQVNLLRSSEYTKLRLVILDILFNHQTVVIYLTKLRASIRTSTPLKQIKINCIFFRCISSTDVRVRVRVGYTVHR